MARGGHRRTRTAWRTRPYSEGDVGSFDPGRAERREKRREQARKMDDKPKSPKPPTEKQLAFLRGLATELGEPVPSVKTSRAASAEINLLLAKKRQRAAQMA